jgi:mannose-6-phosphate isomerase
MFRITGVVQHYAWGGTGYIPDLLDTPNITGKPCAEYWLGVHPGGPSKVSLDHGAHTGLPDLIKSDANRYLGERTKAVFGEWPYLLKVLDVKGMLSIQVHPTLEEARKGFAAENAEGIPIDAPHRNYKDPNHKPEVMVALSDFWLLHGFNPALSEILAHVPEFVNLLPIFENSGLEGLYKHVMELDQDVVDDVLGRLSRRIMPGYLKGLYDKSSPDFWAARVFESSGPEAQGLDRGVFSIYFFNVVYLRPGQAIFQGAGIPHAYLEGQNVELMSNSDNVLRAGLTPKHIDIPELMRHTRFEFIKPVVMDGQSADGGLRRFPCPVPDFSIDCLAISDGGTFSYTSEGPEIWLVMEGDASWTGFRTLQTSKGQAVFVLPGEKASMVARGSVVMFRAYVP